MRITDESRQLRYQLGWLCEHYNEMVADKDTLDVRLGHPEPYAPTTDGIDPERVYESESHSVTAQLRALITSIVETAQRIRNIEEF